MNEHDNSPASKAQFYIERGDLNSESDFAVICQALIDSEVEKANGLLNQVIIYSKGWYKATDDSIEDIRRLIAEYTGTELEHISEKDAQANIIGAFCHYVSPMAQVEALTRGLGVIKLFPNQEPDIYTYMLGKLSIIKGKYVDMDKKLDLNLNKLYAIYSNIEDAYWHNKAGWVGEISNDPDMLFTEDEQKDLVLPISGEWVEYKEEVPA